MNPQPQDRLRERLQPLQHLQPLQRLEQDPKVHPGLVGRFADERPERGVKSRGRRELLARGGSPHAARNVDASSAATFARYHARRPIPAFCVLRSIKFGV